MAGPASATKRSASSDPPAGASRGLASSGGSPPASAETAAARLLEGITPVPLPPALAAWAVSLPGDLRHVLDAIDAAGGTAWPVGGCVRDVLTGRAPGRWTCARR